MASGDIPLTWDMFVTPGIPVVTSDLPPGATQRLWSPIASTLIAATTTKTGLTVRCELDRNAYPAGRKVSDDELAQVRLQPDEFHGDWNDTILPRSRSN